MYFLWILCRLCVFNKRVWGSAYQQPRCLANSHVIAAATSAVPGLGFTSIKAHIADDQSVA